MSMVENNKLIAEFIGYEVREKNNLKGTYTTWYLPLLDEQKMPEHLFFHESWEWLMPVVEKIEEMGSYSVMGRKQHGDFLISKTSVEIRFSPNQNYLLELKVKAFISEDTYKHPMYKYHVHVQFKGSRREITYKAVVEFIKWYNENQKS